MKNLILALFILICSVCNVVFSQTTTSTYVTEDTIKGTPIPMTKAGSCGSPDGGMNPTVVTPPSYVWLQTNGYCNPSAYGTNPTVCWSFTPTSSSVSINSGYSQTGCVNTAFGSFNMYNSTCNLIGTGLNFTGLTPGQTYTWCMTGAAWGGGGGCTGFNDFCPYYTNNIILPIELINFTCYDEAEKNIITWQTASEINNDYFTLERSANGIHWSVLTTIQGAGNSSILLDYKFVDMDPFISYTYYRLKQTDFDGKFEYSDVCVTQNRSTVFYTYMNAVDPTTIYFSSSYTYEFYNSMGQIVRSGFDDSVDMSGLGSGMYILKINNYTQKFFLR